MGNALARLQQLMTLNLLVFAAFVGVVMVQARFGAWALLGVALVLFGYAGFLGLEFLLLARAHGSDPAPRATGAQLRRAWWGEVRRAPQVFCWQQPFRSRAIDDHLPAQAQGQRGVVLVHGFVCNRGFWNHWMRRLRERGTPFVAVNLEPVFGSIDDYPAVIEEAVRRLEACTGQAPVIVAHSMGGLAVRRWYVEQADAARAAHLITMGTPHAGTWLARWAFSGNGVQMRRGGPWLAQLAAREAAQGDARRERFTCYYGHCDNIVFPPSTATLAGARNQHLEAVAHVDMAHRQEPWDELLAQLNPSVPDAAAAAPQPEAAVATEALPVQATEPAPAPVREPEPGPDAGAAPAAA